METLKNNRSMNDMSMGPGIYRMEDSLVRNKISYPWAPNVQLQKAGGSVMDTNFIDVESDLNNITFLDEWIPEGAEEFSVHNIFVKGNYLYMSYYIFGLQIIDISDPANLVLGGFYDTYRQTGDLYTYDGAWGTFPFFDSEKIIISDRQSGLYAVDFTLDNNYVLGDVNSDESINVLDIVWVINLILDE